MRRILFLARAEVLHVVRDRATLAQVLVVPILQLLVLSNAATFRIARTPTFVVDLDRTTASRGLVTRFAASGHFAIAGESASLDAANEALLGGDVTMVLTIPRDFERSLVRASVGAIELSLNAEKGSAAGIVQAYASNIVAAYAAELSRDTASGPVRGRSRIDLSVRSWYNPTLNYKHYMVPGILVALVTLIGTLLTAQNIAREKELGTLEQLNVTPITRGQFITAKLLPFWVLGLVNLAMGLIVASLVFGVPMRGGLLLLFGALFVWLMIFVTHIAFRAPAVPVPSSIGAALVAGILLSTWYVPALRSTLIAGGPWLLALAIGYRASRGALGILPDRQR